MSADPLSTTFDALAASSRPEADDALAAALDVPQRRIQDLAARAILARGSVRPIIEVLRRFDELSDETRRSFGTTSDGLSRAFRQSLRHGDERLILTSLAAARATGQVAQLPHLIPLLWSESERVRDQAAATLWSLADRLHDGLAQGPKAGRGDLGAIRDEALATLSAECDRFDELSDPQQVVEPLLALGTPRHPAVSKVLRQSSPECRRFAVETLAKSRHAGVLRLFFEFLNETYPPRRLFETLQTRDDPEFVAALLRWLPEHPTATQAANLRQIDSVAWLDESERIAELPEALQGRVPAFVLATGLPEARKMELQEWLVRNASAEGRRGATQVFDRLDFETTRRILLDSLDSLDEDVSAWATSQLRSRHVPGAFRMLVERLESDSDTIRKAAREELRAFTIEHLVSIHDRLSPALCRQAGALVRRIDPDCTAKLAAMIGSPLHRQRVAAVQASVRLGMGADVRPELFGLLSDEDNAIRRLGVEALAGDGSAEALAILQEMRSDPSPRVRQAAERVLAGASPSVEALSEV